jgi:signal transduction histidine kinase
VKRVQRFLILSQFASVPPFWESWWFRGAVVLLVVFLTILGVVFYLKKRTLKLQKQMAREVEQKLKLLRMKMDKKRLETQIKFKADFTAMLVHEMRTPLTSIMGFADMLKAGRRKMDTNKVGDIISGSSRKMLNLINDMLDISKFEAGRMKLSRTNHPLLLIVREITDFMQPLAEAKQLQLDCLWDNEKELSVDTEKVGQVLTNFISNAIKFSPENGKITVKIKRVTREGKEFQELSVEDEGPGVPADRQPYLFDKYSQLQSDRAIKGTGLGLAVSRLIVESHGGKIGYRATTAGGSCFYFTLPA